VSGDTHVKLEVRSLNCFAFGEVVQWTNQLVCCIQTCRQPSR